MDVALALLESHGLWIVFVAVLLDQGGLPLPSFPLVAVAAAFAHGDAAALLELLLVVTAAGLVADAFWYVAGRRYAERLLAWICRLSLSPDSCVSGARQSYARYGAPSLVAAKFVPGFAALATALAGQYRLGAVRFTFWDGLGCLLWGGSAIALGVVFAEAVREVLDTVVELGRWGALLFAVGFAVYIGRKALQRQRFLAQIRMARIGVDELSERLAGQDSPLVLDVRPRAVREAEGWIPGALGVDDPSRLEVAPGREVVVYCACPNEASAAVLAKRLMAQGVRRVRPLQGGIAAWRARGYTVEFLPRSEP
jgi:membrane protein DedA with SNARE-associated domain/rhodanese-related sulfurtransferase